MTNGWTANWEEALLNEGLSQRARRAGAAYTGPGSGNDIPAGTAGRPPPIALTAGIPDPRLVPVDELEAAAVRVLRQTGLDSMQYGGVQGFLGLREWLAAHWSAIDGLPLTPENFCLANGGAGALQNVCETFLDEGDVVLFESPSYPGSIRVIRSLGSDVVALPCDKEGLIVEAVEERIREVEASGRRAKLLYTIPDYQNPTGTCLAEDRRYQLVDLCARHGILIVEDIAYTELGFDAAPPPSLYAIAGGAGVIKAGSFSKVIATGLRVGWCQAGPAVIDALLATRFDMGQAPFVQRLVYEFAAGGRLEDHIARLRQVYERKRDVIVAELRELCSAHATWHDPRGGFFVWLMLGPEVDPLRLLDAADEEGVRYINGRGFFADLNIADAPQRTGLGSRGVSPFIRLAYSYAEEASIPEGIRRLCRAMQRSLRSE